MNTDKIYNNLEGKLNQFWSEQKDIKPDEKMISQNLELYANLKYLTKDGKMLYVRNDKGEILGDSNHKPMLDYKAIYETSPELTIKVNNVIDEKASNKYIDEFFNKTNECLKKVKLLSDLSNYSRFHEKFGKGDVTSSIPNISIDLYAIDDVSIIPKITGMHFGNALGLIEKIAPVSYKSIIESAQKKENFMNSFLEICELKYRTKGDKKFEMNKYLDEKIMNVFSALDDIDKEECSQPLMYNRNTDSLIRQILQQKIVTDDKIFDKYATKDMKTTLEKLTKKPEDEE